MPIDQADWPAVGKMRDWLVYCERIHRANGCPSLSALAAALNLTSRIRVSEMLRGRGWPADEDQARDLLTALGADSDQVDRGLRTYRAARAEQANQHLAGRATRPPDWWQRSGYIDQVGDIAPTQLLDRDDELAELAAWCVGGDEGYVWWQAEPRAGKSALMSWFVLHPPPKLWVVSFFVTARYAGQSDSSAFTDELIDQLAAITRQQLPPATSARERDRLRRQLFEAAAAQAAKTGRRLVLLVDGLDEDCGSHHGSGLPSIARCLPKHPGGAVRVIVAGRPDPPLPADVATDLDHPLRQCRVRTLAASPHAQQVMQLAQAELDQLLAADPARNGGLGYQILGLVTASGGGLEHRDLHELTGRPMFEIDRLLRGAFGRTIAGRTAAHVERGVFLFTHETLRTQAIDRLGPRTLAAFAARLHTWATNYQHQGWPADTPAYLLRGYPRMLASNDNLDRLIALATDRRRHDWMLALTGGDGAALGEIIICQEHILARSEPDLEAALRLSVPRNHLTRRNASIPTSLPAVWAALGDPVRGEALARSLSGPSSAGQALAEVARAVAAAGDHERAESLARSLDPPWQPQALAEVARAVAAAGGHDRAEVIAESLADPYWQAAALAGVARTIAAAGDVGPARQLAARAETLARSLDPDSQPAAMVEVIRTVAAHGDFDRADGLACTLDPYWQIRALTTVARDLTAGHKQTRRLATRAEALICSVTDPHWQARAVTDVAWVVAVVGDYDRAESLALSLDPYWHARALVEVAKATAAIGCHDRARQSAAAAEAVARSLYPDSLAAVMVEVACAVAAIGDYDRAEHLARSLVPSWRARALAAVAQTVSAAGDYDRARLLATNVEELARSPSLQPEALVEVTIAIATVGDYERAEALTRSLDPTLQEWPLAEVVAAIASAGDYERAEALARSIRDPYWEALALTKASRAAAAAGDSDRARQFVANAEVLAHRLKPGAQAAAMAEVARVTAALGNHDQARHLAVRAESIARHLTDRYSRTRALRKLVRAAAGVGDYDWAENLALHLAEPSWQAHALTEVAHATAAIGDDDRARQLAERAEALARSDDPVWQVQVLPAVAGAIAAAGDHDRAERLARSLPADQKSGALTQMARAAAAAGNRRFALQLQCEALAIGPWRPALPGLVEHWPQIVLRCVDVLSD